MTTPDEARRLADEFEAAQTAATAGPWMPSHGRNELAVVSGCNGERSEDTIRYGDFPVAECEFGYDRDEANQTLICLARNTSIAQACRDLAAEVERLQAERDLIRRSLQAIHERTNMARQFVSLFTCGFTLEQLEVIYQGCRLCVSDDGSVLDAQWEAAKKRIAESIK